MQTNYLVLDLESYGRNFKSIIMSIVPYNDGSKYRSKQTYYETIDFIYKESTTQILRILNGSIPNFVYYLSQIPQMEYFRHIPDLMNNSDLFATAIKEFGMNLAFTVANKSIISNNTYHLLHDIKDDYIVLYFVLNDPVTLSEEDIYAY